MSDYREQTARPSTGGVGTPMLGVRKDTPIDLSGANSDWCTHQFDSYGSLRTTNEGGAPTYFANSQFACDSTGTDIWCFPGVTTKVIKVLWIAVASVATSAAVGVAQLLRRSVADTAGTPANATIVKASVGNAAAAGQPVHYTAHPTALGTGVAFYSWQLSQGAVATAEAKPFVIDFRAMMGHQALRLNNVVTDILAFNVAAALGATGNAWHISVAWEELPTTA